MALIKSYDIIEKLSTAFSDNDKLLVVCENIAIDIENGKIKLFKVVEELGEYLTNKDTSKRENGVQSLSTILAYIPQNFLNEQELQLMTSFYCDRLNDHHSIIPATVKGILEIVQKKNLPQDAPSKLLHALFRNVRCQSELQETRRTIYGIFQVLLDSRLDDLKSMGPDFVYGVISSMDGESDPRNLILLFNFLPCIIKEFDLHHLTEEMFEVIACYFPVDFNSNPKEGTSITRDDLANALELCLSAIPQFSDYCLPLIIEKLDTISKIAKMDSLRLLARGSITFGVNGLKDHLDELWQLLRKEALPGNDQELKEQTLKTITAVTKAISEDEKILNIFIEKVMADTRSSLCDVQLSLYWPAEKIAESVGKANDKACRQVLKTIVALCLAQYTTNISKNDRISLIQTLNSFMTIYTKFDANICDIAELSWSDLPSLYLNELSLHENENTLKVKLIDGLAIQKATLTELQRQILYTEICNEIDSGNDDTRHSCQMVLIKFAKLYPNEVLKIINERLVLNGIDNSILKNRIEGFGAIGRINDLGPSILRILVALTNCQEPEISLASFKSLKQLLMLNKSEYNIHYFLYDDCNIMDNIIHFNFESVQNMNELCEFRYFVSNLCLLIFRKLNTEHQEAIIEKYFDLLKIDVARNIIIWEGLLTSILPCNIRHKIIDLLIPFVEISLYNTDEYARLSACKSVAVIINKLNANDILDKCVNEMKKEIVHIFNADIANIEHMKAAVIFHTWITKALITRGNQISQNFFNYQLELLTNSLIGQYAGENFRIFVDKTENTLIEDNFCSIKFFYKQRVFQDVIKQNETFIDSPRRNYLTALIHVVEEVPVELLFLHLVKLVPLLIESLALDDAQLILSTLNTLKLLLDTKNEIFVEQIQSFIPRCLKLSSHPKMHVRIAALNCLNSYCNYSTASIKPYKNDVLEKLSETIDDKKRLVRQTAVSARIRWYLIGAPGTPE